MTDIYIILYSQYELADCYTTYSDGVYYTDKNKAIKHLEDEGYKYICDDEYEGSFQRNAEILKLEKAGA